MWARAAAVLSAIRLRSSSAKAAIMFKKNRPIEVAVSGSGPPCSLQGYPGPVPGLGLANRVLHVPEEPV